MTYNLLPIVDFIITLHFSEKLTWLIIHTSTHGYRLHGTRNASATLSSLVWVPATYHWRCHAPSIILIFIHQFYWFPITTCSGVESSIENFKKILVTLFYYWRSKFQIFWDGFRMRFGVYLDEIPNSCCVPPVSGAFGKHGAEAGEDAQRVLLPVG